MAAAFNLKRKGGAPSPSSVGLYVGETEGAWAGKGTQGQRGVSQRAEG